MRGQFSGASRRHGHFDKKEIIVITFKSAVIVLKVEGDKMKEFMEKYREVMVQTSREKAANTQYNEA